MDERLKTTFARLLRALIELAVHAIVLVVVLGLFRLVQKALEYYWGGKEVRFFDAIPLRYIFDGADLVMLLGILTVGVYNAVQAYRGR